MAKGSVPLQRLVKRLKSDSIPDPLALGKPSLAIPGQRAEWQEGTRRIMPGTGYVHIKRRAQENGRCEVLLEHRVVLERELGRPLEPGESARHRNGDGLDNRPENLILFQGNRPVDLEDAARRAPGRARAKPRMRNFAMLPKPRRVVIVRARSAREAEAKHPGIAVSPRRLR